MAKHAKKKSPPKPERQSVPAEFRIVEAEGESDFRLIEAADTGEATESGEAPKLRRFTMTAYTGGKLHLPSFPFPVVADLSGMRISAKARPILRDHNLARIVGHTENIEINQSSIRLAGVISAANDVAREVAASADNGFPWQASIGATASKVAFVDEGESVEVNGRRFTGPLYVARQSVLREISFVALGADDQTMARVAAGHVPDPESATRQIEVNGMDFEQWLTGLGLSADKLDESQAARLQALHALEASAATQPDEADQEDGTTPDGSTNTASSAATLHASDGTQVPSSGSRFPVPPRDPVDDLRAQWAAERRRIARICEICAGQHAEIEAKAIEEGWDANRTELAVLRASRPQAPAIGSSTPALTAKTLEAAACLSAGLAEPPLLREYGERTLEAAQPLQHIGLRELVVECARLEGASIPRVFGDGTETIRAGFSTISLPGILENVMNKTLLAAYQSTPIAAFQLCAVGTVADFKEVSRYRLLGTGGFEQVAPDGELKHGQLGEQKFSNKAETYGQLLMLTRQDIINDDLDAFLGITRQMGRSGAELVDDLFFTLLLSNPDSFFSTGNGNYKAGADTAFGSNALTDAKTLFRKQKAGPGTKAKDKKPINIRPELLLVPVELETEAELLMGSAQLMIDASGSPTKIPVDNPHRNKYEIVSAPHLSDTYYNGSSGTAWYLFARPGVLPAFEIVFLNGRRPPVIERVEAPPNMLGMGFRSYLDVGVREQDFRAAVKMKGVA
ncbi:hypothetical protein [Maioricimonas sp. JC845]|uniref:phage major capsid protein n=1 Tax=Maioricimonas sp. JC845 TaxID=3232138 RepID=UPI0034585D22